MKCRKLDIFVWFPKSKYHEEDSINIDVNARCIR